MTESEESVQSAKISSANVRRLLKLAYPHRFLLLGAALLMLISTSISLSMPLVARTALDQVLASRQIASLDKLALALGGLIVFGAIIGYVEFMMVAYAGNRVVRDLRLRLYGHLLRLPVTFFDRTRAGDLTSRLSNDVSLLQATLTDDLVRLAGNLLTLVGGISVAVVIDWRLTLVVVVLLLGVVSIFVVFGKRLRKITRESLDALSDAMGSMTEALGNIRLVRAFAREVHEEDRAQTKLERVFRLSMKSSVVEAGFGTVAFAGFILVLVGVMWYGGRNVLLGHLSAGSLLAFVMTITIISGPMGSLAYQYSRLQRAIGASDRLFAILDDSTEPPDPEEAVGFPAGRTEVRFDGVTFAYPRRESPGEPSTEPQGDDRAVLSDLTLRVPAGKVTALVGASGAGKTTVALLLYRFYDATQGHITIDGVPIGAIQRNALRENIGIVPQEPVLFNGTIRDNILYGRLDATPEEMERAAQIANVDEFVQNLPERYDTMLGERGITLSGGQRQRVAIARAVLKDPRILVLDEATSALDTKSELLVREALDRLMQGRTTLVIAHRLSTIQNADQIAVIRDGRVTESGTHDELLKRSGDYAALQGLGVTNDKPSRLLSD